MTILSRISNAWNALAGRAAPAASGLSRGDFGGGPLYADAFGSKAGPGPTRLVEAYKSIIFFCANLNADGVVRVPLRLYAASGGGRAKPRSACAPRAVTRTARQRLRKLSYVARTLAMADNVDEVTEHPLLDVIDRPDPDGYFDRRGLLDLLCRYVDVVGWAYLRPVAGAMGPPVELWPLQSQYVLPVQRTDSILVDHYRYFAETYQFDELLRFRLKADLRDPYASGYSAARAAWEYAGLEDKFVSIQDQLLNSPRPGLLVRPKDSNLPWGEPERKRVEADMNRHARGRAGGVIASSGALEIDTITYPPADMAGLGISEYNLERIANCFGVPMPFLSKESNLANMQAAESAHARNAIEPRCHMIAEALTRLARKFDDRLFFAFDPAIQDDRIEESRITDRKLKNGTLTVNEARLEDGYEAVSWGDEPWQSNSLVQPSQAVKQQEQALEAGQKAIDTPAPDPNANADPNAGDNQDQADSKQDNPPAEAQRNMEGEHRSPFLPRAATPPPPPPPILPGQPVDPDETNIFGLPDGTPISAALKKLFSAQLKAILGTLPEIGSPLPQDFPPLADYSDPMAAAMTPILSSYWDEAGKQTRAKLGLDPTEWKVTDPHLQEVISQSTYKFAASTNQTTSLLLHDALAKLRVEMAEGLVKQGDSIPELRKRVQSVFDNASDSRAERIARTEASRAVHAASLRSAKESGVVAGKVWLLSSNACPLCHSLAAPSQAAAVPLDDEFGNVGTNPDYASIPFPPGHPHCRCTVTYKLTEKYEKLLAETGVPDTLKPGPLGPEKTPKLKPKPKVQIEPPPPAPKPAPAPKVKVKPPVFSHPIAPPPTPKPTQEPSVNPAISRAIEYAARFGIKTVSVDAKAIQDFGLSKNEAAMTPALWSRGLRTIFINSENRHWVDTAAEMKRSYGLVWFSSKDPDHIIHHEVGHELHFRAVGLDRFLEIKKQPWTDDHKSIANRVSRYGTTSATEFVAETRAGMVAGQVYDAEVMALYNRLGGPMP